MMRHTPADQVQHAAAELRGERHLIALSQPRKERVGNVAGPGVETEWPQMSDGVAEPGHSHDRFEADGATYDEADAALSGLHRLAEPTEKEIRGATPLRRDPRAPLPEYAIEHHRELIEADDERAIRPCETLQQAVSARSPVSGHGLSQPERELVDADLLDASGHPLQRGGEDAGHLLPQGLERSRRERKRNDGFFR
jgi:hypothetical protein